MKLLCGILCAFVTVIGSNIAARAAVSFAAWPETKAMQAAPDDAAIVFAFVNRALSEGREAEAVYALERLLRFRSDNATARALLARIYARMGLGDDAPEAPAPDEVKVSGYFALGAGYDSNPASTPVEDRVALFIPALDEVQVIPFLFNTDKTALTSLEVGLDVETPGDATLPPILFEFAAEGTHFTEASDEDEAAFSLRAGPLLGDAAARTRPFVDIGFRIYDDNPYSLSALAGVEHRRETEDTLVSVEAAVGWREYYDTSTAPSRDEFDGAEARLAASGLMRLDKGLFGRVGVYALGRDAEVAHRRYLSLGVNAGLIKRLPMGDGAPDLTLSAGGAAAFYIYDGADPAINPNQDRRDQMLSGYARLSAAFDDVNSVDLTTSYRRRYSRYDIFDSKGFRATLRYVRRF